MVKAPGLPTGIVTFVFTDVEDSTSLFERLGDAFEPLLQRHRALLRATLGARGGREVATEGDGCFFAFADAGSAVRSCIEAQEALAAESWPRGCPLRVRMGLHTDEALADGDNYLSLAVNVASRICDAGHGGQIVCSEAVVGVIGDGCVHHDLGRFVIRGTRTPLRLHQLQPLGEPRRRDFPPLRPAYATPVGDLLERDGERAALSRLLAGLRDGRGGAALLEGPPGIGKTTLLEAAIEPAGAEVLRAHGSELESGLVFGGIRQLLGAAVLAVAEDEREELFRGPAALAAPVLGLSLSREAEDHPGLIDPLYGLYWLVANLAERGPLVLAIDDLNWFDPESLRFIGYLLRRLEGLPIVILATARTPEPGVEAAAAVVQREFSTVIGLSPLGREATGRLLADRPAEEVHRLTGGNPLLIVELGRALATAPEATPLGEVGSPTVARLVLDRVARISAEAGALARAVSLFPDGARLDDAAAVAELAPREAERAADALVAAQIFTDDDRLAFLHPMMRAAVYDDLGTRARRRWHQRVARRLKESGAPTEEVAAHLLASPPDRDAENVLILRAASDDAVASVAPRAAARYLERAIAEGGAEGEELLSLLLDLGRLQRLTGQPDAQTTLTEAFARSVGTPTRRARAAIELTATAFVNVDYRVVRATVEAMAGADLGPDDRLALDMLFAESAWVGGDLATCLAMIDRLPRDLPGDTPAQRLALVMAAAARLFRCEPLHTVVELLERAIGDRATDALVGGVDVGDPLGWLIFVDELDRAQALAEERQRAARETGNEALFAATQNSLGWIATTRGDIAEGEAAFRLGLAQPALSALMRLQITLNLAEALIMRGALEDAEAELGAVEASALESGMGLWIGMRRAEIATWRGDWATALPLFEDRYQREQAAGMRHPNALVWTMDYADCLAGVGRRDEAIELTRELVALSAQAGGILGAGTHQLTLGRLTGDIAELERALAILEPSQYRWMTARAQLELGAALRRDGQRTKAREHLRSALDYAARNDVVPFAQRARQELRLAGARLRSRVRTGVDALTPAEDRIARLAAEGRSNKEIAQQLFVTVKTVETNLVRAYRKLDINSRRDLPTALGQPA